MFVSSQFMPDINSINPVIIIKLEFHTSKEHEYVYSKHPN